MNYELSILIPTYNCSCISLVKSLHEQAERIDNLRYEIVVADDGSTDMDCINSNKEIEVLSNCHYIYNEKNCGRTAIRNFLAAKASLSWLLFLDSDVCIHRTNFLEDYLRSIGNDTDVVYGGVTTNGKSFEGNLRWKYEQQEEPFHSVVERRKNPYNAFRTTNFAVRKSTMLALPFDETITTYGYEDVVFGTQLKEHNICISHIDNPCTLGNPESNEKYIKKINEALYTLSLLEEQVDGFSPLLSLTNKLRHFGITKLVLLWHKVFEKFECDNLTGNNPSLLVLKLYKLGTFITIKDKQRTQITQ